MSLRASVHHDRLPADALLTRIDVRETLAQLPVLDVEVVTHDADADVESWLGRPLRVELGRDDEDTPPRVFAGVLEQAAYVSTDVERSRYQLRARPRLHALSRRVRTRSFCDLDAVAIVQRVVRDAGLPDAALVPHLARRYPRRPFCLQYLESDLQFVLRLLEDEGIFHWFEYGDAGDVWHLGDAPSVHRPIDAPDALVYAAPDPEDTDRVTSLKLRTRLTHDAHRASDWNPERPAAPLDALHTAPGGARRLRDEFPAGFAEPADGARHARDRFEAAQRESFVVTGTTGCRRLAPGRRFTLRDARPGPLAREYLAVAVTHTFRAPLVETERPHYESRFEAIPSEMPFRPARCTARPRVHGVETAVITTPAGQEIGVDALGRIHARFHFDREAPADDTSSHWIRVQQPNTADAMWLPRVGWEVAVGFEHGDPDRPIVLHRVYNAATAPPYGLPGAQTQTAIQSASTPGGGAVNELRFEDAGGGMELGMHAARDLQVAVGHDATHQVTVNARDDIGHDLTARVTQTEQVTVGGAQRTSVRGDVTHETVATRITTVAATDAWSTTGAFTVTTGGARSESIGAAQTAMANHVVEEFARDAERRVDLAQAVSAGMGITEVVGGNKTERVTGARIELTRGSHAETVGTRKTQRTGMVLERVGGDMSVTAGAALTLSVGGAIAERVAEHVTISGAGVVVTAPGGAEFRVGGTQLTARAGQLRVQAGSLGTHGGPLLQLRGRINYRQG